MKQERNFLRVVVTKKGEAWVQDGHPWIYDAEVISAPEEYENGTLVDAVTEKGKYLGTGFISRNSKIRVRLISRNANDKFDADFFRRRIKYAWDYRKTVMGDDVECCRVIFGEADGFPGLTVDRFGEVLVTQSLSVGIEKYKDIIFPLIYDVLTEDGQKISGIYERNDVAIRNLEGLEENKGWYPLSGVQHPDSTETAITENGIKYSVDFENGQKTGFFLDQKYNRLAISKIAKGKRVLDCFTHTGSFALNAAKGGAEHVCAVDISESAIEMAKRNAQANGLDKFLVAAVIKTESNFIHDAHSGKARGLMQLTDETAEWIAGKMGIEFKTDDVDIPEINIKMGCWYLKYLIDKYDNVDTALAAYNGGMGNVSKWLADKRYSDDGKTLKYIPFEETRNYVKKVNSYKEIYEEKYKDLLNP